MKSDQTKQLFAAVCATVVLILVVTTVSNYTTDTHTQMQAVQRYYSAPAATDTAQMDSIATRGETHWVNVTAFNDVETLRQNLSANGIGELREWKNPDGYQWMSITSYYDFGSSVNGIHNSLAYYLTSQRPEYVQQLRLVLDVHNKNESNAALNRYATAGKATFLALSESEPAGLGKALQTGKAFAYSDSKMNVVNEVERSYITTYKLIITAKQKI